MDKALPDGGMLLDAFDGLDAGIAVLDNRARLLFVNSYFAELLALPAPPAPKTPLVDTARHVAAADQGELTEIAKACAEALASAKGFEGRLFDYTAGDGRPVSLHLTPLAGGRALLQAHDLSTESTLRRTLGRQALDQEIVSGILRLALQPVPLENTLSQALELILTKHELGLAPKGAIFLVNEATGDLVLTVHRNLPDVLVESCRTVATGYCLCGRAVETGEIVFAAHVDERHDVHYPDMPPHGHYCVPIRSGEEVLGVLTLYVPEGHRRTGTELRFVTAVADALAGIILRDRAEHQALMLSFAVSCSPIGMVLVDTAARVDYANPAFLALTGCPAETVTGQPLDATALGRSLRDHLPPSKDATLGDEAWGDVFLAQRDDQDPFWCAAHVTPMPDAQGVPHHHLVMVENVSQQRELQNRLWQAQKVESLGNLAGGIAHDFNNLLLPMVALTNMTLKELPAGSAGRERLEKVLGAAQKAQVLIETILAFTRQQEQPVSEVDPAAAVHDTVTLLGKTLPATVTLVADDIQPGLGLVRAAGPQLETILLNLIGNAVDALAGRPGRIDISLQRVAGTDLPKGTAVDGKAEDLYALLEVTDNGPGIPLELLDRIFDPFFTTKEAGKGTGLGLATVSAIVRGLDGYLDVLSTPGQGTTFRIHLPLIPGTG